MISEANDIVKITSYSPYALFLRRFKRNRLAISGAMIVGSIVLIAIFAPFIAPRHYAEQNLPQRLSAPNSKYILGTDSIGRDLFSRLIYGSRIALMIGILIVTIQAVIGVTLGLISGYYGGIVDSIIMRAVDTIFAFPTLVLAIAIAAVLGPGLFNIMVALGTVGWAGYARMVRGQVLSVKENDYIEAARAVGVSNTRIMLRHIFPNIIAPLVVLVTLTIPGALLAASALSFLGLGAQPPMPCWGAILAEGREFMRRAPWIATFPGLAIMITVLGFNFLGDGLRDALDPRLKT